jgi:hypothetical protein
MTRQSITREMLLRSGMDARLKPAHDEMDLPPPYDA